MATYSRVLLSGSTSGRPIAVSSIGSPGTLIHTAVAGATSFDEVYSWVSNTTTGTIKLTVEWGGTTDPSDHMVKNVDVPANSPPIPISVGQVLNGGLSARAFANASGLNFTGYVNRISA